MLALRHHQNPFLKNLCLIGAATENWHTTDTLAAFIRDRLPTVLRTGRAATTDAVGQLEINQAEPITAYYSYEQDSLVLVDSSWVIPPSARRGHLLLGVEAQTAPVLRGAIQEILDEDGRQIVCASQSIARLHQRPIRARWVRSEESVLKDSASGILALVAERERGLREPHWHRVGNSEIDVVGVLLPEEVAWRESKDGWLFVVRVRRDRNGFRSGMSSQMYLARSGPAGVDDIFARVPEMRPLRSKRVAIVGLGCVGAPSALEFARAGLRELRLMDGDFVEPGTLPRWPFGLWAAGRNKAICLAEVIKSHYPYTDVSSSRHRLGDVVGSQEPDLQVLDAFLSRVDLVVDASAELLVSNVLASVCREMSIPFISIWTTPGGWGGLISRFVPGRTEACWLCLQHAVTDSTIPWPPSHPMEFVQPAGCASPTFTGAGFDIQEVSLAGVRLAVSTLCGSAEGGYPDVDWDVGVLTLRNESGIRPPTWQTFMLQRHPSCQICNRETSHGLAKASST